MSSYKALSATESSALQNHYEGLRITRITRLGVFWSLPKMVREKIASCNEVEFISFEIFTRTTSGMEEWVIVGITPANKKLLVGYLRNNNWFSHLCKITPLAKTG